MNISELCIRRPVFASVFSMMLVIFGVVALERLALREYPDISRPVVSISTTYRGASASVVENKVTQAIEDRVGATITNTIGAAALDADIITAQFCHAAFVARFGGLRGGRGLRALYQRATGARFVAEIGRAHV